MARHTWSERKIKQWEAEGRGKGTRSAYQPWLEISDISSSGRSRRIWSNKTGRMHHLFSDVEHDIFLMADWSRKVVDIREQYPLDRELTQTVAQRLQIAHPTYPGTHVPTVMTVDFVLTLDTSKGRKTLALNAKVDDEAEDARSIDKLEVQRTVLEDMGVDHHLIYRSRIPKRTVENLEWIRLAQPSEGEIEGQPGLFETLKVVMQTELSRVASTSASATLAAFCEEFDARRGQTSGMGLRVARMLMHERALTPNLEAQDLAREPLRNLLAADRDSQPHAVGAA